MRKVIVGVAVVISIFAYFMYRDYTRTQRARAGRGQELEQRLERWARGGGVAMS